MTPQRFRELVAAGPKIEMEEMAALMTFKPRLTRMCAHVRFALWAWNLRGVAMR